MRKTEWLVSINMPGFASKIRIGLVLNTAFFAWYSTTMQLLKSGGRGQLIQIQGQGMSVLRLGTG